MCLTHYTYVIYPNTIVACLGPIVCTDLRVKLLSTHRYIALDSLSVITVSMDIDGTAFGMISIEDLFKEST